jgi:hypothetical protein
VGARGPVRPDGAVGAFIGVGDGLGYLLGTLFHFFGIVGVGVIATAAVLLYTGM